jgi:NADH:ubiquinone oxidoreductase subunit F (NADH-binding)
VDRRRARDLPLDPVTMRERGLWFGAGVIAVIPETVCGVVQSARVMTFMAGESAGQCGPCVFGLRAIAEAAQRIADGRPEPADLARLSGWGSQLVGRGACAHPDGAVTFLSSGLLVFADEFDLHVRGRCSLRGGQGVPGGIVRIGS